MLRRVAGCLALAVGSLVVSHARADERPNPRTDYTAYTRPGGRVSVGPLKAEFGIIDEITVGTYVPPWFAFPVLGVPIPNGYLKARSWWSGPITLALRGGLLFIDGTAIAELADEDASASVLESSGELDVSFRFSPRVTLSAGLDYNHLSALGDSTEEATTIEGASTADTWNSRLFFELGLTRVFSLTFLLRYLIYQSPVEADASTDGEVVSIDSNLSAESGAARKRFAGVAGFAFDWEHWELSLGIGYGVFPLPALGIPTSNAYPIVDFAFAYRFDLYD
jgi:hypothetical protein